jgi:hypothetical protein
MQNNNSKLNTILLVIIIILLAIGIYFVAIKRNKIPTNTNVNVEMPTVQNTNQDLNQNSPQTQPPSQTLRTSQKFGLKYPRTMIISENYYLSPVQEGQGVPENRGTAQATLTAPGTNLMIAWGGPQSSCMPDGNEFGAFQYGVSTIVCVRGMRAQAGVENVRFTLIQSEKDLFGDFVKANQ